MRSDFLSFLDLKINDAEVFDFGGDNLGYIFSVCKEIRTYAKEGDVGAIHELPLQ